MYTLKNQRIFNEIIHGTVDQQPKLAAVQLNLYFANDVYLLDHHFIYVHTCVSVQVNATCAGGGGSLQRSEKGIGSLGAGITGV